MITQHAVIDAFLSKLHGYGVRLSDPGDIKLDGEWHRAHVEGDSRSARNLSYRIHFDDRPAGFFEDHKRGFSDTFSVVNGVDMDPAARAEAQKRWAETQRQREAQREQDYQNAAAECMRRWSGAGPVSADHPYLARKQLAASQLLRQTGDLLVIPLYSDFGGANNICSLQTIDGDGGKLFHPGGRTAGAFHPIAGPDQRRILICEGWATGKSVADTTGHSVLCAMSAANLGAVYAKAKAKFPSREIVVMADNDHGTESRTGVNPGLKYASAIDGPRILRPLFPEDSDGTDWDDWLRINDGELLVDRLESGADDRPKLKAPAAEGGDCEGTPVCGVAERDREERAGTAGGDDDTAPTERQATPAPKPKRNPKVKPVSGELITAEAPETDDKIEISWKQFNLSINGSGTPHANIDNVCRVLERHPELCDAFWYDEFDQRVWSTWRYPEPFEWADSQDSALTLWLQRKVGIRTLKTSTVTEAVNAYAYLRRRNSCREWLESLQWDGEPRLPSLLHSAFGTPDDDYHQSVGRCWIVSMVARVLNPGCKADYMPVFEGAQGIRKSTAMSVLGGRWFSEAAESPLSKDFYLCLTGMMLVEIAEMDSFSKADIEKVKQAVSCQRDRYRKPYGKRAEDHPRTCVFAGTVNRGDWNRDETGARRFWPVMCFYSNVEWIKENREQLFAEAVARLNRGECYWDVPEDEAKRQQEDRRSHDEWETVIAEYLIGRGEARVSDILADALGVPVQHQDKLVQMRVARALTTMGWKRSTVRRGSLTVKVWTADGNAVQDLAL